MFEREIYRFEVPPAEPRPGDLFYCYEIKNWEMGSRLYKIIGVAALLNLVLLTVSVQGNLFMRRGCESPFVGSVCEVLDTVYVASALFGTEREYADVAYEKTELADAEITYIDVSNVEPPFTYPEGYFPLANPEMAYNQSADGNFSTYDGSIPGFPSNPAVTPSNPLINTPPITPRYNPKAVTGSVPDSPFSVGGDDNSNSSPLIPRKDRKGGRVGADNSNTQAMANANTSTSNPTLDPNANKPADEANADQNGIFINKRPLKDKATETLVKIDAGSVKLDKAFRVVITGTLGLATDGKTVVLKNPKVAPVDKNFPGDPALTKLAQDWVVAVGDAGWYGYLGVMDEKKGVGRKIIISIEQNDATFLANLKAEQPSPERANTTASALYNMMTIGALAAKGDELTFLKSTKTASEGNFLVVNFEMPKPQVQEMIQRKLAESKEPKAQPNSTALVGPQNNSASK